MSTRSPIQMAALSAWCYLAQCALVSFTLSYRDLEMMQERGVAVGHSTLNRWVWKYAPELDLRIRPYLNPTNDSWRVYETYILVKGQWKYLYRVVDSEGNTLDFLLSAKRSRTGSRAVLRKMLNASHLRLQQWW